MPLSRRRRRLLPTSQLALWHNFWLLWLRVSASWPCNGIYNLFISFWFETQICRRFFCHSGHHSFWPCGKKCHFFFFLAMFSQLISNEGGIRWISPFSLLCWLISSANTNLDWDHRRWRTKQIGNKSPTINNQQSTAPNKQQFNKQQLTMTVRNSREPKNQSCGKPSKCGIENLD